MSDQIRISQNSLLSQSFFRQRLSGSLISPEELSLLRTGPGPAAVGRPLLRLLPPSPPAPPPLLLHPAVKSIKKQHLVEVRSMANPPAAVKLALESICLLLGESTTDWKQIRSIIMRENFIPTIVNFSAEEIR